MSDRVSSWCLWLYGLASVFIKGASHVGMVILTGTGVAQLMDSSGAVTQQIATQPLTPRYFLVSLLIGGAIKAFAYLEEKPLPALRSRSSDTIPPMP